MAAQRIDRAKRDEFLEKLTALSQEYGIQIVGCGCCDSPYLANIKPEEKVGVYWTESGDGQLGLKTPEYIARWSFLKREREEEDWPNGQS